MRERNISWSDLRAALAKREITVPYPGGKGIRIYSKAGTKPIIVGIRGFPKNIFVMTLMN
jgi:hypothetical protein